jgi:hypothetical protein
MVATEERHAMNVGQLVDDLESLKGIEKQAFAKKLSYEQKKAIREYVAKRDSEKVNVVYRCLEIAGGSVTFSYKAFENEAVETVTLVDGQEYQLPIYVVKSFNQEYQGRGCFYPTHAYALDAQGKPVISVGKKNRRYILSNEDFRVAT